MSYTMTTTVGGISGYVHNSGSRPGDLTVHPHGRTILTIQAENGGDAIIKTNKNMVNLDEVAAMMETLKDRLLIITPDFEKHEKYPALKEAYEHYKLIEAMCKREDKE